MFVALDFVPLLLAIFISFHESETASTAFTARPSDPSYAVEGRDFTLEWTYTLDGTVGFSQFFIVSVNGRESVGKKFGPGNITSEPKYQARFKAQATNTRAELTILAVQRSDETRYQVNVAPTGTGSLQHEVAVIVQYQPNITFTSVNQTVNDRYTVWLNCTASGFPAPNISWTRLSTDGDVNMPFDIMGKQDEGVYRCTANNGIGNPATADVFVTVQFYRPFNTNFSTNLTNAASLNETFYLMCSAEANPKAEYRLFKEDERVSNITAGSQNIALYETSVGDRIKQVVYKCIPFNSFGDGPTKTLNITMHYRVKATGSGENVTVAVGEGKTFTCPVDGNPEPKIEWYNNKTGIKISNGKQLEARESGCYTCVASNSLGTTVNVTQCLIVDPSLTLPPTTTASQRSTSAPSSTKQTSSEPEGTSSPSTTKPTSSEPEVSAGLPWVIIVAVTGGVVVLLIVVGVLTWCVHKKRKCIKDSKIHNSDLERDEGGYSQVQGAYAQSGPPAANGAGSAAEQQLEAEAAIPTYAVVDKSKKSKMQADEKPPEYAVVDKSKKKEKQEAAAIPTYSAVDKSKKKKKSHEEVPAVYAEVDKSKKKKKKKMDDKNIYETFDEPKKETKPGELLYADLGDFQNPSMPTVSISPQPLPAIKKADPYERTDYADITQFFKGNATLPPNDGNGDTEMKPKRPSKKDIQGNDKETPI